MGRKGRVSVVLICIVLLAIWIVVILNDLGYWHLLPFIRKAW